MKNKLKFLIKNSLHKKTKSKWFLVTHIFLLLLIIGIVNIDNLIKTFGGDFTEEATIYVIDNTNSFDIFSLSMENSFTLTGSDGYVIELATSTQEEITNVIKEEKNNDILLVLDHSEIDVLSATMISNGFSNMLDLSAITSSLTQVKTVLATTKYGLTEEEINAVTVPIVPNRIVLDDSLNSADENMDIIMSTVFPLIILPFFMLSMILVQMIGAEVNDEKTTRGMEIIISNVSPAIHLTSKVVSATVFVVMQAVLLLVYGIIGLLVRTLFAGSMDGVTDIYVQVEPFISSIFTTDVIENLYAMIPLVLFLMFLTLIAYALLAAILASSTTNAEDFQQLQAPLMIISLAGYYLAMMSSVFEGAIFIKIVGYIPLISAILSPSLFFIGDYTIINIIIAIVILILFIFILIKYGMKIYKVGILNYSSKNLWKTMFKALKS